MLSESRFSERWHLDQRQVFGIILHTAFFWSRLFCYCLLILLRSYISLSDINMLWTNDMFECIAQFNLLLLFLILKSLINTNLFGIQFSICLMFHNTILALVIPATATNRLTYHFNTIGYVISFLFFLEGIVSLYIVFLRKYEYNITLFKQIGADQGVNNAFKTRKSLESFQTVDLFFAVLVFGRFWVPNSLSDCIVYSVTNLYSLLVFILQFAISLNCNQELVLQRKIALCLSILKTFSIFIIIACRIVLHIGYKCEKLHVVFTLLWLDILAISLAMHWYLIKDYKQFGSGLKNYYKCKTTKLML